MERTRDRDRAALPEPMRREVRLLGDILGEIIRDSGGPGLLADVERLRHAVIEARHGDRDAVAGLLLARVDDRVPQPLHVSEQAGPAGIADDLAEDVAEQPDVAPHRLRQRGAIKLPVPVHD